MLTQAILIGLVAMCVTFEWALGTCLASRPIVTGVLIGLDGANFCGVRGRAASAPPAPKAIPPRRGGQGPPL